VLPTMATLMLPPSVTSAMSAATRVVAAKSRMAAHGIPLPLPTPLLLPLPRSSLVQRLVVALMPLPLILSTLPPPLNEMSCNGNAGCDDATAERQPRSPSQHHGGRDQGCLIPGGNPRGQLSSHSPLVRWLVVASTPPPLVLSNPPARHPSRCHPLRCHLCCRTPSQRCGHRWRYLMHGSSAAARASEGAADAPPTTLRCRLRPTDAPPPLPRQCCTPIAPPKEPSPTSRRCPTTDASRVGKRRRASEGLLLLQIVVSAPPCSRLSLPT
jgi:hypothetical protein